MIELIINDELITGLDEIRLTKAVNDLGDLPSRQGEYSVTLTAPPTKSNYLAFGMIEQINNLSRLPKQINTYYLYESGVLVSNGTARILSVKNGIEFVLISNNSDWVGLLEDRSLRDLDVSENDYSLTTSNTESRRLSTTKMCLPNVYYGGFVDPLFPFRTSDFKPAFFVYYLIEKTFSTIGYTLVNQMSAATKSLYNKIVTIPTSKWLTVSYTGISYKGTFVYSDNGGVGWSVDDLYIGGDLHYVGSELAVGYPTLTAKGSSPVFTDPKAIKITTDVRKPNRISGYIEFETNTNQPLGLTPAFNLLLRDATTNVFIMFLDGAVPTIVTNAGVYRIDIDVDISAYASSRLEANIALVSDWTLLGALGSYKILGGEITIYDDGFEQQEQNLLFGYDTVADTAGCLPDIKQTDLLRTVVNQFMLLLTTNTLTKEVFFIPLDTVIDNIPNAIDWSDRVDLTEEHEIIYDFFDNYSQRNWMRYKDDDKDTLIFGSGYGSFYFDYDNENLPAKGEIFQSEFSAIHRSIYTLYGVDKTLAFSEFYPDKDLNPKLGFSKITTDNLITMTSGTPPAQSNEIFFDDIAFANLIQNNYQALQRILNNGIAIKMLMRLTRADFTNMDFSIPIFLDLVTAKGHVRGHFYVNQISQYNVGAHDSCEVTLIQID